MENLNIMTPFLIALIGAATGIISLILSAKNRKAEVTKTQGDAASVITDASIAIVKQYKEEFEIIKSDVKRLQEEAIRLEANEENITRSLKFCEDEFIKCKEALLRRTDELAILVQELQH